MPRVPQLDDSTMIMLNMPTTTEEWADEALQKAGFDVTRTAARFTVSTTIMGNCDALTVVSGFLGDVHDALAEVDIDLLEFELLAVAEEPKS